MHAKLINQKNICWWKMIKPLKDAPKSFIAVAGANFLTSPDRWLNITHQASGVCKSVQRWFLLRSCTSYWNPSALQLSASSTAGISSDAARTWSECRSVKGELGFHQLPAGQHVRVAVSHGRRICSVFFYFVFPFFKEHKPLLRDLKNFNNLRSSLEETQCYFWAVHVEVEEEKEEAQESWRQESRVNEAALNRFDCRDETSRFPAALRCPASPAVA